MGVQWKYKQSSSHMTQYDTWPGVPSSHDEYEKIADIDPHGHTAEKATDSDSFGDLMSTCINLRSGQHLGLEHLKACHSRVITEEGIFWMKASGHGKL